MPKASVTCPTCGHAVKLFIHTNQHAPPRAPTSVSTAAARDFIAERIVLTDSTADYLSTAEIHKAHSQWCAEAGQPKSNPRAIGASLAALGLQRSRTKSARYWHGLKLRT